MATRIYVDNQVVIAIRDNPIFYGKTKHFKLKYYFLREIQKNEELQLVYSRTKDQLIDLVTNPLSKTRFKIPRNKMKVYGKRSKEEC